jgi:hypothetical protein
LDPHEQSPSYSTNTRQTRNTEPTNLTTLTTIPTSGAHTSSSPSQPIDDGSLPARANTLATSLAITPPAYEIVPLGDGFCACYAKFASKDVRYHPELLGEVGKVDRVCGRKTAKAESAREVIRVLEDISRRRERVR